MYLFGGGFHMCPNVQVAVKRQLSDIWYTGHKCTYLHESPGLRAHQKQAWSPRELQSRWWWQKRVNGVTHNLIYMVCFHRDQDIIWYLLRCQQLKEMAQWLTTLDALPKDSTLIPSIHLAIHKIHPELQHPLMASTGTRCTWYRYR